MPKIIHYRKKCVGCGVCFEMQPALWRMSKKDGKATLVNAIVKKDISQVTIAEPMVEISKNIGKACPVGIIKII